MIYQVLDGVLESITIISEMFGALVECIVFIGVLATGKQIGWWPKC